MMIGRMHAGGQAGAGEPALWQHFGKGTVDPLVTGSKLPDALTSYKYSAEMCPPGGSYSIARRVSIAGCINNSWIPLSSDFNSDYDPSMDYGFMMLVNDTFHATPRVIYVDTIIQPMCPGTDYTFSAAIINLVKPEACTGLKSFPNITLHIEDILGNILFADTSGSIGFASSFFGYKFGVFRLSFKMPGGNNRLVAKIKVISDADNCGNDFAIDDIKVAAAGPRADVSFLNEFPSTILKSVCFQQNKTIELTSEVEPFYARQALQWQQSTDGGTTWSDIPGATANVYSRNFSVPDTFLFRISVAEANKIANKYCRVVSDVLTVQVNGIPSNLKVETNAPVCAGQQLTFLASGGASYEWFGPNGFYDNIPFPHIYRTGLKDSGMYYADIFTLGGCKARDSVYVKIIGTDVSAGNDTAICLGQPVTLQASKGLVYRWTSLPGGNLWQTQQITVLPSQNTTYTLSVTDKEGCTDSASVSIKLRNHSLLQAGILAGEYVCYGLDSMLFTSISKGDIEKWNWNFDNGNFSLEKKPRVQYYYAGAGDVSYTIILHISDSAGCTDSISHKLKVAPGCYIAVPTGFTPNGDGLNDFLYPLNAFKATRLTFRVYNREGLLLFETHDWNRRWDGNFNGIQQPSGAYAWMLNYVDAAGKAVLLKGTTMLIR